MFVATEIDGHVQPEQRGGADVRLAGVEQPVARRNLHPTPGTPKYTRTSQSRMQSADVSSGL
jgi:hypothetical protein